MNRANAVRLLIERHEQEAVYHLTQVSKLKTWLYELEKPGFTTSGWRKYPSQGRIEPYLIASEHSQRQGDDLSTQGKTQGNGVAKKIKRLR